MNALKKGTTEVVLATVLALTLMLAIVAIGKCIEAESAMQRYKQAQRDSGIICLACRG